MNISDFTVNVKGENPYNVGLAIGKQLGPQLGNNIDLYIESRLKSVPTLNFDKFRDEALPYLNQLPLRFKDEYLGLADASGLSLLRLAEWAYLEVFLNQGCSSFFYQMDGHVWVAHNNDTFVPHMWGYVTIRHISGRIPTMSFGLEGDVWTTAGVNQAQLWLQIDYLPVSDHPLPSKPCLPSYGFIVEALETCSSITEVQCLLNQIDRLDGMILFVLDGKTDQGIIFECSCSSFTPFKFETSWCVRTNHSILDSNVDGGSSGRPLTSHVRFNRLENLLKIQETKFNISPKDLINLLADDQVERRGDLFATAYSTLACPFNKEIWFTFGGYPSASHGHWARVPWPWD